MKELKWASLVSGGGTTMREMALATQSGEVPGVKLELVLASTKNAGAIKKAEELGLEQDQIVVLNPNEFKGEDGEVDQDGFGKQILIEFRKRDIDFFTQNGWLKRTPIRVIEEFEGYNQHPQRPREFGGKGMYGLRPHGARLYYAQMAGEVDPSVETVAQKVSPEFDGGEVVVFQSIPIPSEILTRDIIQDGASALQQHVLPHEHRVQIDLLKQIRMGTARAVQLPQMPEPQGGSIKRFSALARNQAILNFPHA